MLNYEMYTTFYKGFDKNAPLKEYPRPSLKRDSYINLNGIWNYQVSNSKEIPNEFSGNIVVPYVIESILSGIRYDLGSKEYLWYKKEFKLDKEFIKDEVILHFDGVFQVSDIYLNGTLIKHNDGGFLPFEVEIKEFLKENNVLLVCVRNKPSYDFGLGKEGYKRGGMWYTKTSGIWKTVWLESYSKYAIKNIKIEASIDGNIKGSIDSLGETFDILIKKEGLDIASFKSGKEFEYKLENPMLWDPDSPNLYDIEVSNEYDKVASYFGIRKFEIKNKLFYLNDKPIFLNGLLDQGYFSDGIYTPATYEAYSNDILKMKELGFNTLRKHIKVEPEMFYYLADKLGMLVMQDFPNSGNYSFLLDSALPTIGVKKIKKDRVTKTRREHFLTQGEGIMKFTYMHPSVVYYTIFNEGWGQFNSEEMYYHFKPLDESRVFDATSGWFKGQISDVESIHVYFKKIEMPESNLPVILSEYGGYNYRMPSHIFNDGNDYGYHKCVSKEELTNDFIELIEKQIVPLMHKGMAGAIYTQVSDVEDETNGLLTYDRQELKVDVKVKESLNKLKF